jgi:hypothetical protein
MQPVVLAGTFMLHWDAQSVLLLALGPAGQTQTLCFSRQVHTKLMKLSPQTQDGE